MHLNVYILRPSNITCVKYLPAVQVYLHLFRFISLYTMYAVWFQAAAATTDDKMQQQDALKMGQTVAETYVNLLCNVLAISQQPGNAELKKKLVPLSKNVATSVSNLVRSGESMKGGLR